MVNVIIAPDIYTREWASFSTAAYPANRQARSGDIVLIVNTAIEDSRPTFLARSDINQVQAYFVD